MIIYIKKINYLIKPKNIEQNLLNKINNYQSDKKRIESLNGYELLFEIMKEKNIEPNIYFSNNGKPYLLNNEIYFNISHSKDYVILGISSNEIGIDIEKIDVKVKRLKTKFTNKKTNSLKKLTKIWTIKESFIKAINKTILMDLKKIKIKNYLFKAKTSYDNIKLETKTFKYNNYYISLTSEKIKSIKIIELS